MFFQNGRITTILNTNSKFNQILEVWTSFSFCFFFYKTLIQILGKVFRVEFKIQWLEQPRWLSSLALPSAQGVILETQDWVPCPAPCMEPASPSAYVSASLSLCVCVSLSWINKWNLKKKKRKIVEGLIMSLVSPHFSKNKWFTVRFSRVSLSTWFMSEKCHFAVPAHH